MKPSLFLLLAGIALGLSSCSTSTTTAAKSTTPATHGRNENVKIMNGKRYVFIRPELGSNIPGRWVPEDSPDAQLARQSGTLDKGTFTRSQEASYGSLPENGNKLPKFGGPG